MFPHAQKFAHLPVFPRKVERELIVLQMVARPVPAGIINVLDKYAGMIGLRHSPAIAHFSQHNCIARQNNFHPSGSLQLDPSFHAHAGARDVQNDAWNQTGIAGEPAHLRRIVTGITRFPPFLGTLRDRGGTIGWNWRGNRRMGGFRRVYYFRGIGKFNWHDGGSPWLP
jgi:hypothetical protein